MLNPDPGPGPVIPEFPVPALAPALAMLTAAGWFVLRDRRPAPAMARLGR